MFQARSSTVTLRLRAGGGGGGVTEAMGQSGDATKNYRITGQWPTCLVCEKSRQNLALEVFGLLEPPRVGTLF